jgi:hypothetical protein
MPTRGLALKCPTMNPKSIVKPFAYGIGDPFGGWYQLDDVQPSTESAIPKRSSRFATVLRNEPPVQLLTASLSGWSRSGWYENTRPSGDASVWVRT